MTESTCADEDCARPTYCRGLCQLHYGRAWRLGLLAPAEPPAGWHRLTNVDRTDRTATCSRCGQVGVRVRRDGSAKCMTKRAAYNRRGSGTRTRTPVDTTQRRKYLLWNKYRLRIEDYERLLAGQGGCCAICGAQPRTDRPLDVDHCHETGRVRGLLCNPCNNALRRWGDNPAGVERVLRYVTNP